MAPVTVYAWKLKIVISRRWKILECRERIQSSAEQCWHRLGMLKSFFFLLRLGAGIFFRVGNAIFVNAGYVKTKKLYSYFHVRHFSFFFIHFSRSRYKIAHLSECFRFPFSDAWSELKISEGSLGENDGSRTNCSWCLRYWLVDWNGNWTKKKKLINCFKEAKIIYPFGKLIKVAWLLNAHRFCVKITIF